MLGSYLKSACMLFIIFQLLYSGECFKLNHQVNGQNLKLHHHMTKREIQQYFGVETHEEVPDYDVTSPYQSDAAGNFLTNKLHEHARQKRDAEEPNMWYYKMEAFGMSLHLNLTKNNDVVAPGLIIETVHKNGTKENSDAPKINFYSGNVISDPQSTVAVSNHDGLKGFIGYLQNSFFLHPLPEHLVKLHDLAGGARPHLIYRRSPDEIHNKCKFLNSRPKSVSTEEESKGSRSSRNTRSLPRKYLEVMMVGDHLLLKKHSTTNEVVELLLTLAHVVNGLYHDESIGSIKLTVVVVRVVLLQGGQLNYTAVDESGTRLGALQVWIKAGNMPMSDQDPAHADQVLLVTGNGSGGLAKGSSTCSMDYGVSVSNGDQGLGAAFILAHESAHTMGIGHDGSSEHCPDNVFIMSTTLPEGKGAFHWSPCSRAQFQTFFSGPSSTCLDDKPAKSHDLVSPAHHSKLPGQRYDGDAQCVLQYGIGYSHCKRMQSDCESLFCTDGSDGCVSRSTPPAEGTKCGERKWCIKGECVDDGSPMIDGEWSEWSAYQPCSYSCGGGVQYRKRTCTNPPPANGGMNCEGENVAHWRICNPEPCDDQSLTFREHQCANMIAGSIPYMVSGKECELICKVKSTGYPKGIAANGTRCYGDRKIKDVCIEGKCRAVGCDNILESGIKQDRCKVCNGDSTTCKQFSGVITEPCKGNCTILEVPIGATDVYVAEEVEDWNFLGVKDQEDKEVYPVRYTWSTVKKAAGTEVHYYHRKNEDADKVYIPGPTTDQLTVYYLQYVARAPVDFRYKAPVAGVDPSSLQAMWDVYKWSACSHACAGGVQTRTVECVLKEDYSYVNDKVCKKHSEKPATQQKCNTHSCDPIWYVSGWRPCTKTCGKGVQTRQVICRQEVERGKFQTVSESLCSLPKPTDPSSQECNKIDCPPEKVPGHWSACSTSCRAGIRTRSTSCQQLKETGKFVSVPDVMCSTAVTPPLKEVCNQDVPCPGDRQYEPIGCFKDNSKDRALSLLIKNIRGQIDWQDMSQTVAKCAELTENYDHRLIMFGIQYYGECWSGYDAENTFDKWGQVPYDELHQEDCWQGVGGSGMNFVYRFLDWKG